MYADKGTDTEKQYYVTDPHGNVVQLTDESGAVTKTYEYDSFGNEVNPDGKDDNPFRYCGEYYDKETEEIYLRARYYQLTVGRFLTRDAYTGEDDEPMSLHLYTYCENDGVNCIDPSGHYSEKIKVKNKRIKLVVKKQKSDKEKTQYAKALYKISKKYFRNVVRRRVMVAQSCEETGYGTSDLAVHSKNLFGITGSGTQGKTGRFSKNKKLVDSTKQYSKLMKKSAYYKAARKVIKKKPKDAKGYIKAMATNYCDPPEPYINRIMNMLGYIRNRKVW